MSAREQRAIRDGHYTERDLTGRLAVLSPEMSMEARIEVTRAVLSLIPHHVGSGALLDERRPTRHRLPLIAGRYGFRNRTDFSKRFKK